MATVQEHPAPVPADEEGWLYYPPVETHLVRSKHVAQTFKVQVMQPPCKRGETTRFPTVYASDGNLCFDMFKGISYLMQSPEPGGMRFILVAIGYPAETPPAGALLRARDLTFPLYPELARKPPPIEGVLTPEEAAKDFRRAEDFQQFIEHELVPLIDEKYPTSPGDRTYVGHSAGGGFGLFTLFTRPQLFRNYVASSPGLIYHGRSTGGVEYENYDFVLQHARRFIESRQSLNGVRLYMSVGGEEEFEPNLGQWQLTSSFYRLAALLRGAAIPGLELTTEVFPRETHMTAWPVAFIHGMQTLFGRGASRVTRA
jgi:uncharacterized protein